jgi:UPF0755 protein
VKRSARSTSRILWILTGATALLLATGFLLWEIAQLGMPTPRSKRAAGIFRVAPGASLRSVASALADSGWIRHPRLLGYWAARQGLDRSVYPGRYRLRRGLTPREVILEIASGSVECARVTIPEGWREAQVLQLLADSLEIPHEDLAASARDADWIVSLGVPAARLEGYLFPETYVFPKEYGAQAALERMVRESEQRFDAAMRARAAELGLDRNQVVTLASVVQAEAAVEKEMTRIACVFHNRLRRGWRLEADPTVLYALGRFTGPVLERDLAVASPYNTYKVFGLPPGPIGNPGLAALRAALWPDTNPEEMYFVAKGNGQHAFTKTLEDHNRAKRFYRGLASMKGR